LGETRTLLRMGSAVLDLSLRTHIMGILNITPDSFSDGGRFTGGRDISVEEAVESALKMAEEGADIIDIGGETTKPGAQPVPLDEELARVVPVIEGIRRHSRVPISIDTYKPGTAKAALAAGADIINDIAAGGYLCDGPGMLELAAATGAPIMLMHMKGQPRDMQADPRYDDVAAEVRGFLLGRAKEAEAAGVAPDKILLDPGIGFGKNLAHNLTLINRLDELAATGYPVVLGTSRKAFIGRLTGVSDASDRVDGTVASSVAGIMKGAKVIRVHDVKAAKRAAAVVDAIIRA
jgi:dihydropteroate synthase